MSEAYIFDAIRTPRGKGKASGSLRDQTTVTAPGRSRVYESYVKVWKIYEQDS